MIQISPKQNFVSFFYRCFGIFFFLLLIRVIYLYQSSEVASLTVLIPGLDEDMYWKAARNLRDLKATDINFELLSCSTPLHVLWLAFLQTFTDDILTVKIIHSVLASLRYTGLWALMAWFFGRPGIAALVTIFIGMIPAGIVFDASLLKTVHDLNFMTMIIALSAWVIKRQPKLYLPGIIIGLLLSLSILNQLNTILFFVPIVLMLWLTQRPRPERIVAVILVFGLAMGTFSGFRTFTRQAPSPANKWSMIPHTGFNLYLGVFPGADVDYKEVPGVWAYPYGHAFQSRMVASEKTGRPLSFLESDQFFKRMAFETVFSEPGRIFALFWKRALSIANYNELKGVHYMPYIEKKVAILNYLPSSIGVFLLIAPFGLFCLWRERQWAELSLLGGLVAIIFATGILLFVFSRFRLPIYIPLGMLAVPALAALPTLWQPSTSLASRMRFGVSLAVISLVVFWPLPEKKHLQFMKRSEVNEKNASKQITLLAEIPPEDSDNKKADWLASRSEFSKAYSLLTELAKRGELSRNNAFHLIRYQLWLGKTDYIRHLAAQVSQKQLYNIVLPRLPLTKLEKNYLRLLLKSQSLK